MSETTSTNTKTFKLSATEAALIDALRAARSAQEREQPALFGFHSELAQLGEHGKQAVTSFNLA